MAWRNERIDYGYGYRGEDDRYRASYADGYAEPLIRGGPRSAFDRRRGRAAGAGYEEAAGFDRPRYAYERGLRFRPGAAPRRRERLDWQRPAPRAWGRAPRKPARGFPVRGYHTYDLDYGRQAGGPTTDYSGRAGYPEPAPRAAPGWPTEPEPERPPETRWGRPAASGRGARREPPRRGRAMRPEPGWEPPARGRYTPRLGSIDRGRRFGPARRPPRHWSTAEPPGGERRR